MPAGPDFPGATAVSHLRVYDWEAADGRRGGSPHLHTASAEGYVVLGGEGELETLGSHGYAVTPLRRGTVLWFTPGTVHRLINTSGDLEILVVMQNAGLPEAGDAVLTFPAEVLADPERYARAVAVPQPGPQEGPDDVDSPSAQAARRRRDLAVEGYLTLREQVRELGPSALAPLHEAAARLVAPRAAHWRTLWRAGADAQARRTAAQLDELAAGRAPHLAEAAVHVTEPLGGARRFGMCGRLRVWDLDGAHLVKSA
ncbi:cupin domain-containing protein [Allostreptomyces psammosilenae]|uniref:cupin domain-containing protein n=1 Tax=Allostreptomyces psammosilenae TaxID=1892865 RepID=UPI0015CE75D0|nr:cupin domain-containing protein [Allostreptomyces psammosilenae]